jgi:hypothetical protein
MTFITLSLERRTEWLPFGAAHGRQHEPIVGVRRTENRVARQQPRFEPFALYKRPI